MRQFLLCLVMLLCSIFMYAVVSFLENNTFTHNNVGSQDGSLVNYDVLQK